MAVVTVANVRIYAGLVGSTAIADADITLLTVNEAAVVTEWLCKTVTIDPAACTALEKSAIEKLSASAVLLSLVAGTDTYHLNRAKELREAAREELGLVTKEWTHEILGVTT